MSERTDTVLREAFEDLATSAPVPGGLARAALGRARRQRLGRAGAVGGAAFACAAAIAAGVVLAPADTPPPGVPIGTEIRTIVAFGELNDALRPPSTHTGAPIKLPPGAKDSHAAPPIYSLLLDPATGRYERMPYRRVRPSPDGDRALVWAQDFGQVGVWERGTGEVRWFEGAAAFGESGEWSPEGDRILFTSTPAAGRPAMVLADPDTMTTIEVRLANPDAGAECIFMELVWLPDGRGVAESAHCEEAGEWRVDGIRTYDLGGRLTGTVPAGFALASGSAYSPGGALILLWAKENAGVVVVDAATGAERSRLPLPLAASVPGGEGIVGWYDAEHLAVYSTTGADGDDPRASLRVVDLDGVTTSTTEVPYHAGGEKVFAILHQP